MSFVAVTVNLFLRKSVLSNDAKELSSLEKEGG